MGERSIPAITNWAEDKEWSDRFIPEIKRILGEHLICTAPIEDDIDKATDLVVLKLDPVRVGCRIRHYEYVVKNNYKNEFTIRMSRPSGKKTELAKVVEGWGDYFFYGFSDEQESSLCAWFLGDLKVFRLWFNRQIVSLEKGKMPGYSYDNSDGSSSFRVFEINKLPPQFVVARKIYAKEETNNSVP